MNVQYSYRLLNFFLFLIFLVRVERAFFFIFFFNRKGLECSDHIKKIPLEFSMILVPFSQIKEILEVIFI